MPSPSFRRERSSKRESTSSRVAMATLAVRMRSLGSSSKRSEEIVS
jgi:hypothetical protein